MRVKRLVGATVCFCTSVAGYFYWPSQSEKKVKHTHTASEELKLEKDFIHVKGYHIHKEIAKTMNKIRDFKVRDDDIFVVSFPKSGTTWVQEIIFLISSGLDFSSAGSKNLDERSPFLEFACPGLKTINQMRSRRIIKTHLPFCLLPNDIQTDERSPKIIYVARNPRDVCVSFYHFCKALTFINFDGNFDNFYQDFLSGHVPYGPWTDHVLDYWKHRDKENYLFITYEALQSDTEGVIRDIGKFLERDLSDSDLALICEHCKFKKMSENQYSNYSWLKDLGLMNPEVSFMRKGKVGDWQNYLSAGMCCELDGLSQRIRDNDETLKFVYSLDSGR